MGKMPFMQFFVLDWLFDTRICTDAEKAVLIDLLCYMWNAPRRGILVGHPQDLSRMVGKEWLEFSCIVDGLKRKNILEVTLGNDEVTLISRRMTREEKSRESTRIRKRRFDERFSNGQVTDKKLEVRSQKLEKDKDIVRKRTVFVKPSVQEITDYCKERKNQINSQHFSDFYESKGWLVGRAPMKDWKAAVRTWEKNGAGFQSINPAHQPPAPIDREKMAKKEAEIRDLAEREYERREAERRDRERRAESNQVRS